MLASIHFTLYYIIFYFRKKGRESKGRGLKRNWMEKNFVHKMNCHEFALACSLGWGKIFCYIHVVDVIVVIIWGCEK
jgi:hypothetical protein